MNMATHSSIDFTKVDQAFQHLADTAEGNAALTRLGEALDHVGGSLKPALNPSEVHYLLTNLVQQRHAAPFGPGLLGSGATRAGEKAGRVKAGFFIKTAVPE
jgi:hypothetical protein